MVVVDVMQITLPEGAENEEKIKLIDDDFPFDISGSTTHFH